MTALAQKLEHFKKIRYICRCDTCQEIFFETSFTQLPAIYPHQQAKPTKWYIKAGRHWLKSGKEHQINIWLINEAENLNEILFDISGNWSSLLSYHSEWTDEVLLRELDNMEKIAQ